MSDAVTGPAVPGEFDDPEMWGYCQYCAFLVARYPDVDTLFIHERTDSNWIKAPCLGGGKQPTEQPGPEAKPVRLTPEELIVNAISDDEEEDPAVPERDE